MSYSEEEIMDDLRRCANCPYRDDIEACLCEIDHKYKETILNIIETQQAEIEKQKLEIEEVYKMLDIVEEQSKEETEYFMKRLREKY